VIVVTHDSRVFHYAHSIAHMDDGRIVNVTRPNDTSSTTTDHPSELQEHYA